jgi:hypothetical protein
MEIIKQINGKEYGFKFTLLTLKKFCEYKKIEFEDFFNYWKKNSVDSINTLLCAAVDVYSQGKQLLNEYQMDELIEQMSQDDLDSIFDIFWKGLEGWIQKLGIKTKGEKKN